MGVLDRLVLSDAQWARMAPLIIGRPDQRGSTGRDNRISVEGVLWIVRTGAPWRDLPEAFGAWNGVFRRLSRWSRKGVWWRIFEALSDDRHRLRVPDRGPHHRARPSTCGGRGPELWDVDQEQVAHDEIEGAKYHIEHFGMRATR